jgi:hypothetical protein
MTSESLAERNIDLLAGIENLINGTLRELFVKTRLVSMALQVRTEFRRRHYENNLIWFLPAYL